jgi:hypothetical protein
MGSVLAKRPKKFTMDPVVLKKEVYLLLLWLHTSLEWLKIGYKQAHSQYMRQPIKKKNVLKYSLQLLYLTFFS